MSTPQWFDFSTEALDEALLGRGDDLSLDPELDELEELRSVARRIAGTHVDVVARYARAAFAGRAGPADHLQLCAALGQLARLAEAAGDTRQVELLGATRAWIEGHLASLDRPAGRGRLLPRLRRFLEAFAGCLEGDDAARLERLVHYEPDAAPLLAELANLRGIGPRRLESLYCSGLYRVDVVVRAAPADVAAVSGLPLALAVDVVAATRTFAERRREEAAREVRGRLEELRAMAEALGEALPAPVLGELARARRALDALVPLSMEVTVELE